VAWRGRIHDSKRQSHFGVQVIGFVRVAGGLWRAAMAPGRAISQFEKVKPFGWEWWRGDRASLVDGGSSETARDLAASPETARDLAARHDPALLPKSLTPQDVRPARCAVIRVLLFFRYKI